VWASQKFANILPKEYRNNLPNWVIHTECIKSYFNKINEDDKKIQEVKENKE